MATATKTRKTKKSKGNGKSTEDIYTEVTNRIVKAMEGGHIPWHKPWRTKGGGIIHQNIVSKKPYRGINPFLLELTAMENGYVSPYWVTFKQAKDLGGNVRKDEKSTLVVFWKILRFKTDEVDDKGKPKIKTIPLLKYYRVFNIEQCENIPEGKIPTVEAPEEEDEREVVTVEEAQAIIDNMQNAPKIIHRGGSAFYSPTKDYIGLPKQEDFDSDEHYYHTAYHEMVHSTGHESRTGRMKDQWTTFGSDPYAKEELVAEMGASMLAGVAGIDIPETQENTTAYIQHWISRFKEDKSLLVGAAGKAQAACDYILNTEQKRED